MKYNHQGLYNCPTTTIVQESFITMSITFLTRDITNPRKLKLHEIVKTGEINKIRHSGEDSFLTRRGSAPIRQNVSWIVCFPEDMMNPSIFKELQEIPAIVNKREEMMMS